MQNFKAICFADLMIPGYFIPDDPALMRQKSEIVSNVLAYLPSNLNERAVEAFLSWVEEVEIKKAMQEEIRPDEFARHFNSYFRTEIVTILEEKLDPETLSKIERIKVTIKPIQEELDELLEAIDEYTTDDYNEAEEALYTQLDEAVAEIMGDGLGTLDIPKVNLKAALAEHGLTVPTVH